MTSRYPYQCVTLNNGVEMPIVGFGTFLSKPGEIGPAVRSAIDAGYRHIDCAVVYANQAEIGATLQEIFAEGKVKREDIFITSKLRASGMEPSQIESQLAQTLTELQTTYLDLYLVHLPVATHSPDGKSVPIRGAGWGLQDVWRAMESLYASGKVKAIGISNYSAALVNDVLCYAKVPPAVNQIERHPHLRQTKLVEFCQKDGVAVTAFGSLGAPGLHGGKASANLLQNDIILKIGEKYGKSAAQVLIRWSVDSGVIAIPKSVSAERIKDNFNVFDFKLSSEDMDQIATVEDGLRSFDQEWTGCPVFF